jgi:hypothetical protein
MVTVTFLIDNLFLFISIKYWKYRVSSYNDYVYSVVFVNNGVDFKGDRSTRVE